MKLLNILILVVLIFITTNYAVAKEDYRALTLNERMIKLETRVDEGFKTVNQRIDEINRRIDILINIMLCDFGIILAGMFALVGFVIWDRRTAVAPVARELKEIVKQEDLILEILKRYNKLEPKLANVIEAVGIRI
jgi:tetrahydromethanopterin S-methyltransferase subunit G